MLCTFSKLYTYVAGPLGSNSKEQVIRLKLSEFIGNTQITQPQVRMQFVKLYTMFVGGHATD